MPQFLLREAEFAHARPENPAQVQRDALLGRAQAPGLDQCHGLAEAPVEVRHEVAVEGQVLFLEGLEIGPRQAQQGGVAQRHHVVTARLGLEGRAFPEPLACRYTEERRHAALG